MYLVEYAVNGLVEDRYFCDKSEKAFETASKWINNTACRIRKGSTTLVDIRVSKVESIFEVTI